MSEFNKCVACGSIQHERVDDYRGYRLAVCADCGLTFTQNPDYGTERYVDAYEGPTGSTPFAAEQPHLYAAPEQRLRLEVQALFLPPPRLSPAERIAIRWLKTHAPVGAVVVECGCGTGRVLRALGKRGIAAVGIEVSEVIVRTLQQIGLRASQGSAPEFPWTEPEPFAIAFFEVLEHFADPFPMMTRLKERFPLARIVASVPSPLRLAPGQTRGEADWPPHHFLRWTPKALDLFFKRLGYSEVQVVVPPAPGAELMPGLGAILGRRFPKRTPSASQTVRRGVAPTQPTLFGRFKATGVLWANRGYQAAAEVLGQPRAWRARRLGVSASSMLVIAQPGLPARPVE